jgi:hypothetical protein
MLDRAGRRQDARCALAVAAAEFETMQMRLGEAGEARHRGITTRRFAVPGLIQGIDPAVVVSLGSPPPEGTTGVTVRRVT